MRDLVTLETDKRWRIGATEFVYSYTDSSVDRFAIPQAPPLSSTSTCSSPRAFHHCHVPSSWASRPAAAPPSSPCLAEPEKLVALELASEPIAALAELIDRERLTESICPYYGVDQSDRALLHEILDREFGDATPSTSWSTTLHTSMTRPGRASKSSCRRVRPRRLVHHRRLGRGLHAVRMDHHCDQRSERRPCGRTRRTYPRSCGVPHTRGPRSVSAPIGSRPKLMQICFHHPEVVAEVTVDRHWITVRRGDAELDRGAFRMVDYNKDKNSWQWTCFPERRAARATGVRRGARLRTRTSSPRWHPPSATRSRR